MLIATLDLALIGRRIPSIRRLPQGRQWADHVAYGLSVGMVLRARRSRRARVSTLDDHALLPSLKPGGLVRSNVIQAIEHLRDQRASG
jgi:hypothetical protein